MIYSVHGYYGKCGSRKQQAKIEAIVFASNGEKAIDLVKTMFDDYPATLDSFNASGGQEKDLNTIYAQRPKLKGIDPETGYFYSEHSHRAAIYRYFNQRCFIERQAFGHWEIDTILGTQDGSEVLLSMNERKTQMRFLVKIPSRTAAAVREGVQKIRQQLGGYAPFVFKTITSDNGREFASLSEDFPEALVYYAHPYSSYERGTNENQNAIVKASTA